MTINKDEEYYKKHYEKYKDYQKEYAKENTHKMRLCDVCNKEYSYYAMSKHLKTKSHLKKL